MELEKEPKNYLKHLGLFVITLACTTMSGAEWLTGKSILAGGEFAMTWKDFLAGFEFSIPFLGILTFHEFGHYFMARKYSIPVTLPYYIPGWLGFMGSPSIGTFGAVIRIKGAIQSTKEYFDVGVAGPLAGFVIAIMVMFYAFTNLPPADFIFEIHPEYEQYGLDYADHVYDPNNQENANLLQFKLGPNILFWLFETYIAGPARMPNYYEIIHFPWLFASYLALFFTALNLLPIGQLDGGHVVFGLFGSRKHGYISSAVFLIFLFYSGLGLISPMEPAMDLMWSIPLYIGFLFICLSRLIRSPFDRIAVAFLIFTIQFACQWFWPEFQGYTGWLLYCLLIGRFMGVHHPRVLFEQKLDRKRQIIGWIALLIFVFCFSPQPFIFEEATALMEP